MDKNTVTKEMVREGLKNGAINGDGHGIVTLDYFVDRGFDRTALEAEFSKGHRSIDSISSLSFHFWVAVKTGVKYETYHGDGKQARAIAAALQKWVNEGDGPDSLKELLRF